jgi:hypothetical protein
LGYKSLVPPSRERPRALALGIWLACRGGLVAVSLGIAGVGALVALAYPVFGKHPAVTHLPTTATLAITWSAGVMLAFACSLRALVRDWEDGVVALSRARGVRASAYVRGRIGGVVVVLAATLGGASIVSSLAATAATHEPLATARDSLAALVYALAFAATLGPVALAALGARSRAKGYLCFFAVLVLPELLAPWTAAALPPGWHELTSIPAALGAVMAGVESPSLASGVPMLRALVGLGAVIALGVVLVQTRTPRVSRSPSAGGEGA